MTIFKHELKRGSLALSIWTFGIVSFIVICLILFPEMKGEMDDVGNLFASLGNFTAAFGMDRLSLGTLIGFYGIECGNVLGIGGSCYAAYIGINALSKEEKERTAEFLFSHPISRIRVISEKLLACIVEITLLNGITFLSSIVTILLIKEDIPFKELILLHTAFYFLQLELMGICFGISSFFRRSGVGLGLGLSISMYFLNILYNLTDKVEFLKYITPFRYCESADIISDLKLDYTLIGLGMIYMIICIIIGYVQYSRKDIH